MACSKAGSAKWTKGEPSLLSLKTHAQVGIDSTHTEPGQ